MMTVDHNTQPAGSTPAASPARGGFTLIEMLVSSAIVTIIMLLFAQVFTLASSSITDQRALARNAQQARAFSQVLRSDLGFRTFRQRTDARPLDVNSIMGSFDGTAEPPVQVDATQLRQFRTGTYDLSPTGLVPLAPGDEVDKRQAGYFYVSENDPNDDTDDVLQLTILIDDLGKVEPSLQGFYGGQTRALAYPGYGGPPNLNGNATSFAAGNRNNGRVNNQPDNDDGFGPTDTLSDTGGYDPAAPGGQSNQRLRSRAAEVVYFLRGGNLYRRSLPLRDSPNATRQALAAGQPRLGNTGLGDRFLSVGGFVSPISADAANSAGVPAGYVSPGGSSFWAEHDLSASRTPYDVQYNGGRSVGNGSPTPPGAPFSSALWINSTLSLDNSLGPANRPLALPWMRFGHYGYTASAILAADRLIGRPREYGVTQLGGTDVPAFIGRFTHAETSDPAFLHPGQEGNSTTDPMLARVAVAVPGSATGQAGVQNYETGFGAAGSETALDGDREGADLLLSNVTAFDIEFYDSLQQQFVDLGRTATSGPSQWAQSQQTQNIAVGLPGSNVEFYGPGYLPGASVSNPAFNNVFDTWHTDCDMTFQLPGGGILPHGDGVADLPPYRSLQVDNRPLLQAGSFNGVGNYNLAAGVAAFWQTNQGAVGTNYDPTPFGVRQAANLDGVNLANPIIGSVVFANPLLEPYVETTYDVPAALFPNGEDGMSSSARPRVPRVGAGYRTVNPGTGSLTISQLGYMQPGPAILFNGSIAFRCVGYTERNGNGVPDTGLDQPRWPTTPGDRVTDGELVWEAFDNRAGLKKMRITIRYNDAESGNPRQVSLVHSFVE